MKSQRKLPNKPTDRVNKNPPLSKQQPKKLINPFYYSLIITVVFFLVALFGMLHHEMWRDEHQPWLIALASHSIPQLIYNMRFEGHPALWHLLLDIITSFTHNIIYQQALHLLIACAFIFVFNRYSEIEIPYKILFSFGYFTLYEYTIITRDYGLAVLLIFITCALYKNRYSNYILLGITLALLANVSIYGVIISLGITGILFLDYIYYQKNKSKDLKKLIAGLSIAIIGVIIALYMIIPDKDNSFAITSPKGLFEMNHWTRDFSRIFTSYFSIPNIQGMHFWNTSIFYNNDYHFSFPLFNWFLANQEYLWSFVIIPIIILTLAIIIFLRNPLVLLLYSGLTFGILSVFYYTNLLWARYSGFLFIILIVCYWLAYYYPDKKHHNSFLLSLSKFGKKIQTPFLILVLSANVIGAMVAYSKDYTFKFSRSKDVANYIRENKLDTLTIVGSPDFVVCPLATYLDTKIFYPQMNDYGTYCIWNKSRKNIFHDVDCYNSIVNLMTREKKTKVLYVTSYLSHYKDGKPFDKGLIAKDIKIDLLKSFEAEIVDDEGYYLYLTQKVNPKTEDLSQYKIAFKDSIDVNFYIKKGESYGREGKYSLAIEVFDKLIELDPRCITAYKDLGVAYGTLKQYQKAIDVLNKAASIDSNDSKIPYFIGITYMSMGDSIKGKKYFEKAKKMNGEQQK